MNYRHAYHAGNFADVYKHVILLSLIENLKIKEKPFCILDTHAGTGFYNLSEGLQQEYLLGIEKIWQIKKAPQRIQAYLNYLNAINTNKKLTIYPGSAAIAAMAIRPQDKIILTELQEGEFKILKKSFYSQKNVATHLMDAYLGLKAYLPFKEKRGLIFIDPPYEKNNEFSTLLQSVTQALKHFRQGIFVLWYPIKTMAPIAKWLEQFKSAIELPMLNCQLSIYPEALPTHLNGNGLLIINPPLQIELELETISAWLWKNLNQSNKSRYTVKFLRN